MLAALLIGICGIFLFPGLNTASTLLTGKRSATSLHEMKQKKKKEKKIQCLSS
jgi:hypothetical protein